jgi:hypothetical protein
MVDLAVLTGALVVLETGGFAYICMAIKLEIAGVYEMRTLGGRGPVLLAVTILRALEATVTSFGGR